MGGFDSRRRSWKGLLLVGTLAAGAWGQEILKTDGFSDCGSDGSIRVDKVDIRYNNDKTVTFDVAGSSLREQKVSATLKVKAYGNEVFSKSFNPCDKDTFVERLCPVPSGSFSAQGTQKIPEEFANKVPDIAAQATLQLKNNDDGSRATCITSEISNGKTAIVPAVRFVPVTVAGVAFIATGLTTVSAFLSGGGSVAGGAGLGSPCPNFAETFGWFQGIAMNGMLSVSYPPIYRSFVRNFAFSTGLVPWVELQSSIDVFRSNTGGNLTEDNVKYLQNVTLVFPDGSTSSPNKGLLRFKRAVNDFVALAARDEAGGGKASPSPLQHAVQGIQAFAEQIAVPKSDVFMTALLVVAIVIAVIVVGILLVKVVLELWALFGKLPKSLTGFRKHYWGSIARTITSLIFILYGIWVLYCIFQFTHGDSWAAKTLAGVTLAIFTGILAFFSWKIWRTARKLKQEEGNSSGLYYKKTLWVKYSIFYESYKKDYWWLFVPTIVYMFVKGAMLAATDGRGMIQAISLLAVEMVMLIVLLWSRPYERKSGNVINIAIAVVRVLSVICVLIFVEELGIRQTTQTVAGVVLIVIQATLTGILAILIAWNAINACCKANPHRKRRKEMEKMHGVDNTRDVDALTPLDARNSLLLASPRTVSDGSVYSMSSVKDTARSDTLERNYAVGAANRPYLSPDDGPPYRSRTPTTPNEATQNLMDSAAPLGIGGGYQQMHSAVDREPSLPTIQRNPGHGYGNWGGYHGANNV